MKKFFSAMALLAMIFATSCSGKSNNSAEEVATLSVDTIVASPETFVGDTVMVEGVVSHLCKHGGKKAFLLGVNGSMIRCEATEEIGGAFPQESIHKPMLVKGVVVESRISEETVQQMEAQHAEQVKMVTEQAGEEQAAALDAAAAGCETERKAQGQADVTSFADQMADYRVRIAERAEKEGKPYLSSYYIVTFDYEILPE